VGCEAYVPTPVRFGKGWETSFENFVTVKTRLFRLKPPSLLPEMAQSLSLTFHKGKCSANAPDDKKNREGKYGGQR
jgi:hypothetical protein